MNRIHSPHHHPFGEVQHAAIAIQTVQGSQQHVGLLHRDSGADSIRLLHLGWHNSLSDSLPKLKYIWVDPLFPQRRLKQVAAICRKVWRSNGNRIPYAFSPPNDCFDEKTGAFLIGPSRYGLTCASFVLAVFHTAGLPLVQYASWPVGREGDAEWQASIVKQLADTGADAHHVEAVKSDIGVARYRPEEVAGASVVDEKPASFKDAIAMAEQVLERLRSHYEQ